MSLLMANSLEEFQDGIVAHTNSGYDCKLSILKLYIS